MCDVIGEKWRDFGVDLEKTPIFSMYVQQKPKGESERY